MALSLWQKLSSCSVPGDSASLSVTTSQYWSSCLFLPPAMTLPLASQDVLGKDSTRCSCLPRPQRWWRHHPIGCWLEGACWYVIRSSQLGHVRRGNRGTLLQMLLESQLFPALLNFHQPSAAMVPSPCFQLWSPWSWGPSALPIQGV